MVALVFLDGSDILCLDGNHCGVVAKFTREINWGFKVGLEVSLLLGERLNMEHHKGRII